MGLVSLQIQNFTNTDVLLYLSKWTSDLDFNKRGYVMQIWVDYIANYCIQKWEKCIKYLGIRLLCLGLE